MFFEAMLKAMPKRIFDSMRKAMLKTFWGDFGRGTRGLRADGLTFCMYVCMYECMKYVRMQVFMYVCMYVCMNVCQCTTHHYQ